MNSAGMIDLQFYLTYSGITTLLNESPDGWDSEAVNWSRDMRYMGMFRKFTISLQFVKSGAAILRRAFYTDGINADVKIIVKKRNKQTNIFETKYTGECDMSTFIDNFSSVEVTCIEGGLSADVQRRERTQYNIPFPTGHRTRVNWSGQISNFETFNWVSPDTESDEYVMTTPGVDPVWRPIRFDENSFKNINNGSIQLADYKNDPGYEWSIEILRDCDLVINITPNARHYSIWNFESSARDYRVRERLLMDRGGVETELLEICDETYNVSDLGQWVDFFPVTSSLQRYPATETVHFLAGDKLTFQFKLAQLGSFQYGYKWKFYNNSNYVLGIEVYDKLKDEVLQAWTAKDLFAAIADKIGSYPVKSDFLDARPSLIIPATAVRDRLNPTNIATTTSLSEFFDALNTTEEIGMGVEIIAGVETLVIERLDHFFGSTYAHSLGNVTDIALSVNQEIIPSEIEIGFNYTPNDDYYGRLEYNGNALFTTPSKRLTNKMSWLSPYRADILGVDKLRLKALQETLNTSQEIATKDADSDLTNWIIDCKYVSSDVYYDYYELNRDYDITGVYWPESQANVRFTPKRCLIRHNYLLSSVLQNMDPGYYEFASASKNYWISTKYTSESDYLYERYPEYVQTGALFYPYLVTFNAAIRFDLIDGVDLNKYGLIGFVFRGETYYGYVIEATAKVANDEKGQVTLLLANVNDLTKLIR